MRVLHITNMYPDQRRPAYGVFVCRQIESLRRWGADCDVLFIDGQRSLAEYVRGVSRIRAALRRGRYDLVHYHYGLTAFFGCVAMPRGGPPRVISYCGSDLLGNPDQNRRFPMKDHLIVWSSQLAAPWGNGLITKTDEMRFRLWRARDRDRCRVVPNGVDFGVFRPGSQEEARGVLGLSADAVYVLFPSNRNFARKRVELAREAVIALRARYPGARLLEVCGEPQERLLRYYQACDCVILTSKTEGSPNVVKEAMACRRPVVSVDVGDVRQLFRGAMGCYLADADPTDLARKLVAAISFGDSTNGREAIEHLSAANIARRIVEELYVPLTNVAARC